MTTPLASFHPVARAWFAETLGAPTSAQAKSWPAIQQGKNTLIAAPTGSGKTLAAFYVAMDSLLQRALRGELESQTQVVYVSPLKALGNDIHRNLQAPLAAISQRLRQAGYPAIEISAAVRTGDTPQHERQLMLRKPPHILVTTPESLYLMLTSRGGRELLKTARTLIVDEIHAMLGDKRGAHLALSMERLENLAGAPLQRIGLSATQKPIELVAEYLVGTRRIKKGRTDCFVVDEGHRKTLDLSLEVPGSPLTALMSNEVWDELYARLVELTASHQTTLIFVNTRRLAERLALSLGERVGEAAISSHHGSMSKEQRLNAEQKLKAGELRVLVATASMELGIDIGSVDLVVQISSPKRIAAFLQRVGRSGHQVGGVPKGALFPLTRDDLVECAALLDSVGRGELDQLRIPQKPLDILAQHIVAELGALEDQEQGLALGDLYQLAIRAWPYRDLLREEFDQLVQTLEEGYSNRRGRGGALLHLDQIKGRVRPRRGARLAALTNGGAIPDMFDYQVVLDPEDTVIGSLNEDFALESLPGDIFTLGHHSWRLLRIDGLKVRVADAQGQSPTIPFWLGEGAGRSRELSQSVSRLRQTLKALLEDSPAKVVHYLEEQAGLPTAAAEQLANYLRAGSEALGAMPSRDCIVMERFFDEVGDMHLIVHSTFGSRVNRAWGLALRKRFCRQFNFELQAAANEDSIVISLGAVHSFDLEEVFRYVKSATLRDTLVQALLDTPMFAMRWRWNAVRALAIQRNRKGQRVPPQFQRMQAEDLIAQVFPEQLACRENLAGDREIPDHPLVRQTIHDCLTEAMDLDELQEVLRRAEAGSLELVARDLREPSPFAQEIINARPYAFLDDAPFEERRTNAIRHRSWLDPAEAAEFSSLDAEAIARVRAEAWPYIRSTEELHEALLVLGYLTDEEMHGGKGEENCRVYLEALLRDGRATLASNGKARLWIAAERLPLFQALKLGFAYEPQLALPAQLRTQVWESDQALVEIIRGRLEGLGPITAAALAASLGLSEAELVPCLQALEAEGFAFKGRYSPVPPDNGEAGEEWCERRLLQRIHRYTIESHRESIRPVSLQAYMRFLFQLHGLADLEATGAHLFPADHETLHRALSRLDGISAPAAAWEGDILPSRCPNYDPAWLDLLCVSGRIIWGRISTLGLKPKGPGEHGLKVRRGGPIKTTPISLMRRGNLKIWQNLAAQENALELPLSGDAQRVKAALGDHGATFFADLLELTGLLRSQLEKALAELASLGLVHSDGFTGLRALLSATGGKARAGFRGRRSLRKRPAPFDMENAGRWNLMPVALPESPSPELDEASLEKLIGIYLERWGVISRRVLERESKAPPWRLLLPQLRRLELQGKLRGGRFIAGIGGEQFALEETVASLRTRARELSAMEEEGKIQRVVINAADPLNLLGIILPGRKVANLQSNRILFENGRPIAVLEKSQVTLLEPCAEEDQWPRRQTLLKKNYPPRLRAYLA